MMTARDLSFNGFKTPFFKKQDLPFSQRRVEAYPTGSDDFPGILRIKIKGTPPEPGRRQSGWLIELPFVPARGLASFHPPAVLSTNAIINYSNQGVLC